MKILVTGSNGFVGKNLIVRLKNIQNQNDKYYGNLINIEDIYCYDKDSTLEDLKKYTKDCDFVFHLAGVNRPQKVEEFKEGNVDLTNQLLKLLKKNNNKSPIMLSSSIQATLEGRYKDSPYGISKLEGENLLFNYGLDNGVKVIVYRFPNLFGKWCKPNYNSVIATFCYNYAHDLPVSITDRNIELDFVYIDDLVEELLLCLLGQEHYQGEYAYVPTVHHVSLGEIFNNLEEFKSYDNSFFLTKLEKDSFKKKLYSTYLSYLPKEKAVVPLKMNADDRGSFTELFKTIDYGQFSINISKPGIIKGNHFHNSKWEYFIVVSGRALIQERNIITDELYEFEVSGEEIKAVYMLPGYTHNIINLSQTENLVTVMWANEVFDSEKPDTYYEKVE